VSEQHVITPELAWDVRRMNRRDASDAALKIILSPDSSYEMTSYEKLANQIFNWLQEEK